MKLVTLMNNLFCIRISNFIFIFTLLIIAVNGKGQTPLRAEVKPVNGRPSIVLNGKAVNPMIYSLTDVPGGRWSWEELPSWTLRSFCDAGFRLYQVDLFFDHVWMQNGNLDMEITKKQLKGVLDICPDAAIFIRFHVNAPKWWQQKYPEENTLYADRKAKPDYNWGMQRIIEDDEETPERTSLASEKWVRESTGKLKEYLTQLAALPEGNSVAGIQIAGGVYGEWHYWGFIENEPDVSGPMQEFFRGFLKRKYATESELRKAWSDNNAFFEKATVPILEERQQTKAGIFRDPRLERRVIDYYEAQHNCVADRIIEFCKIVKEAWPRPIITGAFYGYFYAVFGREVAGGHLELGKVLRSPYVDYLSAPGTYYPDAVKPGDAYRSRSLITSVRLHNKLWLDEMDQQPPLVPLKDTTFTESLDHSIGTVRRNVLSTFSHGAGLWFYDFGPSGFNGGKRLQDHGSWGWWDEPSLMKDIGAMKTALDLQFAKPFQRDADVLLVHDTRAFYFTGSARDASFMGHWANNWIPPSIYKSGVLHDVINFEDLALIDLNQYKVIVFVNTWVVNDKIGELIKKKVAKQNRHLIFLYAPGYCNENDLNVAYVSKLTGLSVVMSKSDTARVIQVNREFLPDAKPITVWNRPVNPFFIVEDKNAKNLGKTSSDEIGFARKTFKDHSVWFLALPPDDIALWRQMFNDAGAHIYASDNDVIYGGSGTLTIHAGTDGTRKVKLKNGREIELDMKKGSTKLVDSQTGESLLP